MLDHGFYIIVRELVVALIQIKVQLSHILEIVIKIKVYGSIYLLSSHKCLCSLRYRMSTSSKQKRARTPPVCEILPASCLLVNLGKALVQERSALSLWSPTPLASLPTARVSDLSTEGNKYFSISYPRGKFAVMVLQPSSQHVNKMFATKRLSVREWKGDWRGKLLFYINWLVIHINDEVLAFVSGLRTYVRPQSTEGRPPHFPIYFSSTSQFCLWLYSL